MNIRNQLAFGGGKVNGNPSLLTAVSISLTSIKCDWIIGSTNQEGHAIERSVDGITFVEISRVLGIISTFTDTLLTANHYYYRVRAFKGTKYSEYTNISMNEIPLIIFDGNTMEWNEPRFIETITKDANNRVSVIADKLGSGRNQIQVNDTLKPIYSAENGVTYDGVDDTTQAAYALSQPTFIYSLLKQVSWSSTDYLMAGVTGGVVYLSQRTATPGLAVYAGTQSTVSNTLAINKWGIIRALFNGENSKFAINDAAAITGNFGANTMGGSVMGSASNGLSNGNVSYLAKIIRKISDTSTNETDIYNYLKNKYAFELLNLAGATVDLSIAVETNLDLYLLDLGIDVGANVYITFGDGETQSVPNAGASPNYIRKIFPTANETYTVKLSGELAKVKRFRALGSGWNINVTEFEKTANIEYIGNNVRPRTLIGNLSNLTKLKEWWLSAPMVIGAGITGSINGLIDLEVLEGQGYPGNLHMYQVTGTWANIPKLRQHCCKHKITGDISMLVNIEYFSWGYAVDISTTQEDEATARIWGDISNFTKLWFVAWNGGAATITGSTTLMVEMENFQYVPPLLTKPSGLAHMPKLSRFTAPDTWQLSALEVNQYLADIWANREVVRVFLKNTDGTEYGEGWREIDLSRNALNAAPTGQGITDKNNLNATISPAIPGNGVAWTITTN